MNATLEADILRPPAQAAGGPRPSRPAPMPREGAEGVLRPWVRAQAINVARHAAALRPFTREEFGTDAAAPSESHVKVVNDLIARLRGRLFKLAERVTAASRSATREPTNAHLARLVTFKENAHASVQAIEKIWDFYFELFGQRQSKYADWLLSCDRIALDCYQVAYMGCGKAKSIPAPPPFSYMRTGFSPATYRRGIRMTKLGRQINPFPLVQLPYHRLVNPWTLGAVLHEVSHNLQSDLGLGMAVPRAIGRRLLTEKIGRSVAMTWVRWNRETYADMSGLLLGGPTFVGSLLDVLARSPRATTNFVPGGPHPTPWVRAFLSFELLRRLGFGAEAERYRRLWAKLYPDPRGGTIPRAVLETMERVVPMVVDTICFQPYPELGNKPLARVIRFEPKEQQIMEEAASRLAAGTDPGVVPARFLIGAARIALDRRLARPSVIAKQFFEELTRR